ncbi:hypothetical protein M0805_004211 [Coniferiporia weirii]|nr:hypothetical protein M0805_004211 [Coniferiporia weirii]
MATEANIRHPVIRRANAVPSVEIQLSVPLRQSVKNVEYHFQVRGASELSQTLRTQIWSIFERNMGTIYKTTNVFEWNPPEKQAEMFDDLSRFILVTPATNVEDENDRQDLLSYSIFRFEREDKRNVIYVYELQTNENARRLGLGKALIMNLTSIGRDLGMSSVMLTHFSVNSKVRPFYDSLGFKVDRTSPDYEEEDDESTDADYGYSILSCQLLA